jgi:hypothetical protein
VILGGREMRWFEEGKEQVEPAYICVKEVSDLPTASKSERCYAVIAPPILLRQWDFTIGRVEVDSTATCYEESFVHSTGHSA